MKKTRFILHLTGLLVAISMILGLGSCGTTRAHFGIEHDVAYNWNQGHFENEGPHDHKHKKPKKPKHDNGNHWGHKKHKK